MNPGPRRSQALVITAIVLLGLNLRPAVNSVGSILPEIRVALGLSATTGGALTSLPPLCFALLGLIAPALASRFRPEHVVVVSLAAMTIGQFIRVLGSSVLALFAGSIVALAGLAMANVLLPSLIRRYFPDRISLMTAVYTTSLAVGATSSAAFSIPIERGLDGDWRTGLGVWGVTGAIALVPWLAMLFDRSTVGPATPARTLTVRHLLRSRVAWMLGLFFGLQAAQAYIVTAWLSQILVDDGVDLKTGGYAVGVFAALGIPLSAAVPTLVAKQSRLPAIIVGLGCFYIAGYVGLLLDAAGRMWLWAVLCGIGSGTFPLVLTLIVLRARTAQGVAALSAFAQCMGYLIASLGPIAIGKLHDLTNGWTVPLISLMASAALLVVFGLQVARPRVVEDDLALP
jgi:CP family cyanate transporter-like MFS transporter